MDLSRVVNKSRIISAGIILLSIFISFKIYERQTTLLDSLKGEIKETEKKNEVLVDISKLKSEIDLYTKLLVKNETSAVMYDINNIARAAGVKIVAIKPSGEETLPEYSKYIFELSVEAPDYDTIAKFINRLESFERVYIVDRSVIESPSYNKDKELRANLRISSIAISAK